LKKLLLLSIVLLGLSANVRAAEPYILKFATLAPEGSTWANIIVDWAKDIEADSHGRLIVKLYLGGVSGDEIDMLQKIRFSELQGAALSGNGIGNIYSPARVLEIPFLFHNYAEVDYVRARLMPEIREGFEKHGFKLLAWMEIGFIHFFSSQPIHSLDDLKKRRIWQWQGDPLSAAIFSAADLSPVPLPIADIYSSLSTGLIDTVYAPPLGAIAFQWFTKTGYMTEIPMADGIGALVVTRSFFDQLPADLQSIMLKDSATAEKRLQIATRRDNETALSVLKQHGVKFTFQWKDVQLAALNKIRDRAAADLERSDYIPLNIYEQTQSALNDFHSRNRKLPESDAPVTSSPSLDKQ